MFWRIHYFLSTLMSYFSYGWYVLFQKNHEKTRECRRDYGRNSRSIIENQFKTFQNMDEYNRDFLCIIQSHRRSFLIDYSQKDGHFRV